MFSSITMYIDCKVNSREDVELKLRELSRTKGWTFAPGGMTGCLHRRDNTTPSAYPTKENLLICTFSKVDKTKAVQEEVERFAEQHGWSARHSGLVGFNLGGKW